MGHKQPPTPIQTDNTTTFGLANDTIKQRLDMSWYWIQDQIKLQHYDIFFTLRSEKKENCFTKNRFPTHYRQIRHSYLHQPP